MLQENQYVANGLSLNCAVGPRNGPPLVFLHGVTRKWQDYVPLIPALSQRWWIHVLDFRGHGRSDRAVSPDGGRYRVVDYVGDVVAFLETVFDEPVVVYGHSLGSMVAAAVAGVAPEHVRGVVLEDPPFETMGSRIRQTPLYPMFEANHAICRAGGTVEEMASKLADVRLTVPGDDEPGVRLGDLRDPTSLRFSAKCFVDLDPDVFVPIVEARWLEGYDVEMVLRKVIVPALLLQADYAVGGMLTEPDADNAVKWMGNCSRVRVPQTGHLIHWIQTETTLRLVTGFLESL